MEYHTICEFCGGRLYVEWNDPDVIKCDTCDYEIDRMTYNNMIERAAHGSSGASELNARVSVSFDERKIQKNPCRAQ